MEVVVRIQIIEGLGPGITERTKRETSDLKGGSKMKEFTIDLHDGRGNQVYVLKIDQLAAYNTAVQQRETWYGRDPRPGHIELREASHERS